MLGGSARHRATKGWPSSSLLPPTAFYTAAQPSLPSTDLRARSRSFCANFTRSTTSCHSRASGNPVPQEQAFVTPLWIPACAGMTRFEALAQIQKHHEQALKLRFSAVLALPFLPARLVLPPDGRWARGRVSKKRNQDRFGGRRLRSPDHRHARHRCQA